MPRTNAVPHGVSVSTRPFADSEVEAIAEVRGAARLRLFGVDHVGEHAGVAVQPCGRNGDHSRRVAPVLQREEPEFRFNTAGANGRAETKRSAEVGDAGVQWLGGRSLLILRHAGPRQSGCGKKQKAEPERGARGETGWVGGCCVHSTNLSYRG